MEVLGEMTAGLQFYWYVAIPVSVIFLLQTIMTFVGADASDGLDADFDGDLGGSDTPFQLFSFRNLIQFLLGFSWSGIAFYSLLGEGWLLYTISVLVGIAFVGVFFIIINQLLKLAEHNRFKISDTLHQSAEVYVPIPAGKSGKGKVQISIKGSIHELDAITSAERLETGAIVRIIGIDGQLLIVEKL